MGLLPTLGGDDAQSCGLDRAQSCGRCGDPHGHVFHYPHPADVSQLRPFCLDCWATIAADHTALTEQEAKVVGGEAAGLDAVTIAAAIRRPTTTVRKCRASAVDKISSNRVSELAASNSVLAALDIPRTAVRPQD